MEQRVSCLHNILSRQGMMYVLADKGLVPGPHKLLLVCAIGYLT